MFKRNYLLIFCFIFTGTVYAQVKVNAPLDRSKPPKIEKPSIFKFPDFSQKAMPNGFEVITSENHSQPTLSVNIVVKGGSYFDGEKPGLSNLVSGLLTKGTTARSAKEIANQIDFIGATLSASSSTDAITISLTVLKKFYPQAIDLLADCVLNPAFPEDEIDRFKDQLINGLKSLKMDPNYLSETKFYDALYPNHPYGKLVSGNEKSIPLISREDLQSFYHKFFIPNNAFCVLVGDLTMNEIFPGLNEKFGGWKKGLNVEFNTIAAGKSSNAKIFIVDRPEAVQSSLRVGCLGVSRNCPDIYGLNVLNTYIGGYFRSELNLNLREKNSFTYAAYSYFATRRFNGPFIISTEVKSEVTPNAVDEIFKEIENLSTINISSDRLNEVKNYLIGSFPLNLQTPSQVATYISTIKNFNLPVNYYDDFLKKVTEFTETDIKKLAQKYLNINNFVIVLAGDSKTVQKGLSKYGNLEVFNNEGDRINQ